MKFRNLFLAALLSLFGLACPQSAHGQFIGDVGLQTVDLVLANSVTCTGIGQTFVVPNIGAISHQATAISNAAFQMEIDGTDRIATYRISNPQISFPNALAGASSYVVQASGYYPKVSVMVTCSPGTTFFLSYAGAQTAFSPLIGPPGGSTVSVGGGIAAQVQGVVAQQQSGAAVNPVIAGGLQLPVNQNFLTAGIDNFSTGSVFIPTGSAGTFSVATVPTPTTSGEFAVALEASMADFTATTPAGPWTCAPAFPGTCTGGSPQMSMAFLPNVSAGQRYQRTFVNSTPTGQDIAAIVLFSSPTTAIRQSNLNSGGAGVISFTGATLAKSTLVAAVRCAGVVPCSISGVTDTQGNTWNPVTSLTFNNGQQDSGIIVWASSTLSTAAADTITFTIASGTVSGTMAGELTGTTTSSLTQPAISLAADPTGALITREDAQAPNQFVCSVTMTTNTTTQCQPAATTINNVPVRAYVTDFQINTTTGGTTSTIQLKTGTGSNCGTGTANLSAITYADTVVSTTNVIGMRTPLIAPLQTAVCVTQAGAAAGTSVVEIHGFFAP